MKIKFDRTNWNQCVIRGLVKNNSYIEFGKHENLRAMCINEEDVEAPKRDWNELTFIVPTKWLRKFCKEKFGVTDLERYLQEEYTTEESEIIFEAALNERKVVMVDFM